MRRKDRRSSTRASIRISRTAATIIGAAKLTGRVGAFSVGALSAVTAEEEAHDRHRARAERGGGRAAVRLHRRPRAPRVRESVERRLDDDVNESAAHRAGQLPAQTTHTPAASTTTSGCSPTLQLLGLSGRAATSPARTEAITRLQENNVHAFQRPDAEPRRGRRERDDARSAACRIVRVRQDRRREDAIQLVPRLQDAGLRHQRPRIPAARRRALRSATGSRCATTCPAASRDPSSGT